ncbi:MAG: flagellar motor protein MotB [Bacillota bacterium]
MSSDRHDGYKDPLLDADHGAVHAEEGEPWLISYADLMTLLVGFFVILQSFSSVDQEKFEEAKKSVSKEFGGQYEKPFEEISNKIRKAIEKTGAADQIVVKATANGVEISFLGPVFFSTGSADIKPEAKTLLDELIKVVKTEAGDFDYVVEGHTDDVPLAGGGPFKSNWELSSIRACRVLEYFSLAGFNKSHLTAIGYGETRPILPNRDANGVAIPENQSQNRRVVIKMVKKGSGNL